MIEALLLVPSLDPSDEEGADLLQQFGGGPSQVSELAANHCCPSSGIRQPIRRAPLTGLVVCSRPVGGARRHRQGSLILRNGDPAFTSGMVCG